MKKNTEALGVISKETSLEVSSEKIKSISSLVNRMQDWIAT
jgi:hypothetical protein